MFTHQRPAMASRYSLPSASTTVEPWAFTMTIGSASSCRCATIGWRTLSRSRRTTAARSPAAGWAAGAGVVIGILLVADGCRTYYRASREEDGPSAGVGPARAIGGDRLQGVLLEREHVLGHDPIGPLARGRLAVELLVGQADQRADEPGSLRQPLGDEALQRRGGESPHGRSSWSRRRSRLLMPR